MKRRAKIVLLAAGLTVVVAAVSFVGLMEAFAKAVDPKNHCGSGFSKLVGCTYHFSSTTIGRQDPLFDDAVNATGAVAPSGLADEYRVTSIDKTAWAVVDCPTSRVARRLLCAGASKSAPVQSAGDDTVTGMPRPKPWLVTTAKESSVIKAFHVETPLDLAGVLGFYRVALTQRGWSENPGAMVEADSATIAFTTSDGPAMLRLSRQGDRTVVDLSLRKPGATNGGIRPVPGQARLLLGNDAKENAVITIDGKAIELAAGAGVDLTNDDVTARKAKGREELNLPPGKYKVSFRVASGAVQNREYDLAGDETWALVAGNAAVPLPVRIY